MTDESENPTAWPLLNPRCSRSLTALQMARARIFGCAVCGRDPRHDDPTRFGRHVETLTDRSMTILVCEECHDTVHRPIGPHVDELMYAHRPPCPRCAAFRTNHLVSAEMLMPLPIGVSAIPTTLLDADSVDFVCTACGHAW